MTSPESSIASFDRDQERAVRIDLAACYRLADRFGFSDVVWGHITAKIPGTEYFLINRFGLRYDEVTASNLVTVDLEGNVVHPGSGSSEEDVNVTGFNIHGAIHAARPEIVCIMHSHSSAGLAVSALKNGLVPMVQDVLPFYRRVSYHAYQGLSTGTRACDDLASSLGDANKAMIMRNHGLLTCGKTVGEAFMTMYYLERACKVQMQVLGSGQEISLPSPEECENAVSEYAAFPYGKYEWPALLRLVDKHAPDFRD